MYMSLVPGMFSVETAFDMLPDFIFNLETNQTLVEVLL